MTRYARSTYDLAEVLRTVSDPLAAIEDTDIPAAHIHLTIQVTESGGTEQERMAAVERLAAVFGLATELGGRGEYSSTPDLARRGRGLSLTIYTPVASEEEIRLRQEVARLQELMETAGQPALAGMVRPYVGQAPAELGPVQG